MLKEKEMIESKDPALERDDYRRLSHLLRQQLETRRTAVEVKSQAESNARGARLQLPSIALVFSGHRR